jgi:alanyl-tRNA synthetase
MRHMPIAEAQKMGAMALFGEKYGNEVRVIRFGESVELCGGTHVAATGNIGFFKIISESSTAAGIRRIEAVTAANAEKRINDQTLSLKMIQNLFNNSPNLLQAIKKALDENTTLAQQVELFIKEKITLLKKRLQDEIQEINGIKVVRLQTGIAVDALKALATQMRIEHHDLLFAGATLQGEKPTLVIALGDALTAKGLNASTLIKEAAKEIGGSGGGQAFIATAGGKDPNRIAKAIDKVIELTAGTQQ